MNSSRQPFVALLLILSLSGAAWSAELFVDQKNPKADDKNAGSEAAPFKTIQAAMDKVAAGDTIWVKEGVYEEALEPKSSGRVDAAITLSAWKDDRVRLGSILHDLPPAAAWKLIEKTKSWAIQLATDQPKDVTVILDGMPIVTEIKDTPPLDANTNWATYRPSDRTLMLNVGGESPAAGHTLQLARDFSCFYLNDKFGYWAFKKLEFAWAHIGLYLDGNCTLTEDCYFHDLYHSAYGIRGNTSTIRRCNFHRCPCAVGAGGAANIMEDCLVVECGADWKDIIAHRARNIVGESFSGVESKGGRLHTCRYNIMADNLGALWYDCHAVGTRVLGNAFWDNHGSGFYNEYGANDTLCIGNYFLNNAMSSSWCTRLSVLDNFFQTCSVTWHNHDRWPMTNSFMTLRGNAMIDLPQPYLMHFSAGWGPTRFPQNFRNCLVDFNHIRLRKDIPLLDDAGKKVRTLEEVRKDYGWEIHGDIGTYDKDKNDLTPESLGGSVVTFRVPWGKNSHLARPMLSDAGINGKWPSAVEMGNNISTPSFFWRLSDGNYDERTFSDGYPFNWPWYCNDVSYQPVGGDLLTSDKGECRGCQWYVGAEENFGKDADGKPVKVEGIQGTGEMSMGNRWLVVRGVTPENVPPQGLGFWTPWLSTIEGAKMTITLKMRGKDVAPTAKGAPAVYVQFINETGQNRQRAYLVGGEPGAKAARPELAKGSFDWTDVKETVVAPKGAIRMALFLGLTPCKGEVDFDDINLTTESAAAPAAKQEILLPRLPLQRIKETFFVDLSKVANRALADQEDNDGKGGWTDQGAGADMRLLATGERKFGGVAMKILPGDKSIVVLKGTPRKAGELPEKVTIPVGRKVDSLFFLHSCAWTPETGAEAFRYVLHYKDGKSETISVVSGQQVTDWAGKPVQRFSGEQKTFTTVADTVANPQFGQGSVYRMEWNCPTDRRAVELESIEFVGNGGSVPALLAISGVIEW